MEAACFQHYLTTGTLLPYEDACKQLQDLGGEGGPISLSVEDYLLGVYDMTGELMRFAITTMATDGRLPSLSTPSSTQVPNPSSSGEGGGDDAMDVDSNERRDILTDLRALRAQLEELNTGRGTSFARDVDKKMDVMRVSVEKVEKALYGLVIRGRERPKGWMPDTDTGGRREVEVDA